MDNGQGKEADRDKKYIDALKANRAVQNSKGKSPSYSTRQKTAKIRRLKASSQYYNSSPLRSVANLITGKYSKNEKAAKAIELSLAKQFKAEDKNMAKQRKLMNVKNKK